MQTKFSDSSENSAFNDMWNLWKKRCVRKINGGQKISQNGGSVF